MNRVILHGNVGKDPEIKTIAENKVAKFSFATQSFRKDSAGNKMTDWHNIVAWGKLADLCEKYVKKGSSLIIEGEIQYRDYTDKEGNKKYFTEISMKGMHFTGKKEPETPEPAAEKWHGKTETKSMSDPAELGQDEIQDLPF